MNSEVVHNHWSTNSDLWVENDKFINRRNQILVPSGDETIEGQFDTAVLGSIATGSSHGWQQQRWWARMAVLIDWRGCIRCRTKERNKNNRQRMLTIIFSSKISSVVVVCVGLIVGVCCTWHRPLVHLTGVGHQVSQCNQPGYIMVSSLKWIWP